MKTYTRSELADFIRRADTAEKCDIALDFINSRPWLTANDKEYFAALVGSQRNYVEYGDDYDDGYEYDDRGSYSPSAPWNAPGMRVSDFIRI